MMKKALLSCGGETQDDFTKSNQTGRFCQAAKGNVLFGNPKRKIRETS
jgi:hypothetical protein